MQGEVSNLFYEHDDDDGDGQRERLPHERDQVCNSHH